MEETINLINQQLDNIDDINVRLEILKDNYEYCSLLRSYTDNTLYVKPPASNNLTNGDYIIENLKSSHKIFKELNLKDIIGKEHNLTKVTSKVIVELESFIETFS